MALHSGPPPIMCPLSAAYSEAGTTWYSNNSNPDIVLRLMFANSARSHGLNVVLRIFRWWISTFEIRNSAHCTGGPGGNENVSACISDYIVMQEQELGELLSNYGTIMAVWLDYFPYSLSQFPFSTFDNYIKGIQPNCLTIGNNQQFSLSNSNIVVYEIPAGFTISTTGIASEGADTAKIGDKVLVLGTQTWLVI